MIRVNLAATLCRATRASARLLLKATGLWQPECELHLCHFIVHDSNTMLLAQGIRHKLITNDLFVCLENWLLGSCNSMVTSGLIYATCVDHELGITMSGRRVSSLVLPLYDFGLNRAYQYQSRGNPTSDGASFCLLNRVIQQFVQQL